MAKEKAVTKPTVTKTAKIETIMVVKEGETEKEFLIRLMKFQHNGGWGKHLDSMINERIKTIEGEVVESSIENPKDWYE